MLSKVNHHLLSNVAVSLALLCVGVCGGCGNNSGGGGGGKLNPLPAITVNSTPEQAVDAVCRQAQKVEEECPGKYSDVKRLADDCKEEQEARDDLASRYKDSLEEYKDVPCGKMFVVLDFRRTFSFTCAKPKLTGEETRIYEEEGMKECQLSEVEGSANYTPFVALTRKYYETVKSTCTSEESKKYFGDVSQASKGDIIRMDRADKHPESYSQSMCNVEALTDLTACIKKYNCAPEELKNECGLDLWGVGGANFGSSPNSNLAWQDCYGRLH